MFEELFDNPVMFRYRNMNIDNVNALVNNYLWFSTSYAQNDPFDGTVDYEWDSSQNNLVWEEVKKYPEINSLDHSILDKALQSVNPFFSDKNPVMISCFSKKYNDILMWSHYANGHRGFCQIFMCQEIQKRICLEVDPKSIESNINKLIIDGKYLPLFPVVYDDKRIKPILSSQTNTENGIRQRIMSTCLKFKTWEYELEYRALVFDNCLAFGNKMFYPDISLFGIILGSEMDFDSIKMLELLCKTKNIHLFKMKKVYGTFDLKMEQVF
jgi:hypothetical protein